jgi:hypothetical protein
MALRAAALDKAICDVETASAAYVAEPGEPTAAALLVAEAALEVAELKVKQAEITIEVAECKIEAAKAKGARSAAEPGEPKLAAALEVAELKVKEAEIKIEVTECKIEVASLKTKEAERKREVTKAELVVTECMRATTSEPAGQAEARGDLRSAKAKLERAEDDLQIAKDDLRSTRARLERAEGDTRMARARLVLIEKENMGKSGCPGGGALRKFLATRQGVQSASDCAKKNPPGLLLPGGGHLTPVPTVDPTDGGWLFRELVPPNSEAVPSSSMMHALASLFSAPSMLCTGETEWVQPAYDAVASSLGLAGSSQARKSGRTWSSPVADALATKPVQSGLDGGYFCSDDLCNLAHLIWENKGSTTTTVSAAAQAAAYASGVATSLIAKGVVWSEVAVPVVICNGVHISFAATIVLAPSFPVYVPLSGDLRLQDEADARLASLYLGRAVDRAKKSATQLAAASAQDMPEQIQMLLDLDRYHVKPLDPNKHRRFVWAGNALHHLMSVFRRLQLSESACRVAVFPLAVRNPDVPDVPDGSDVPVIPVDPDVDPLVDGCKLPSIVFDNLCREDFPGGKFRVGLPDATAGGDQGRARWQSALAALRTAIGHVHRAGVVHGDLYPSNVMWRCADDGNPATTEVEVRIIDWDMARFVSEGDWNKEAQEIYTRIYKIRGWGTAKLGTAHDIRYVDALERLVPESDAHAWIFHDLASGDVSSINNAFKAIFELPAPQN